MPYVTPIFDRTQTDIDTKTAKAYFNIADWTRVTDNTVIVKDLVELINDVTIAQTAVTAPTITTFPTVAEINAICANIENIRLATYLPTITGLVEIKDDWFEGQASLAPDFQDVNSWEQVLDIIYNNMENGAEYRVHCGVAAVGQPRFYQNQWRPAA